jgi:hypothetical protein
MTRIYHIWSEWECYPAGFYESKPGDKRTATQCEQEYRDLLTNRAEFETALARVLVEWPKSCEHYLSNEKMNRIAWLGQASLCIARGIPSTFRTGYKSLTKAEQQAADEIALEALNLWLARRGEAPVDMDGAGVNSKADLY